MTDKTILALRLAIKWKNLKLFCRDRTSCNGCPYAITTTNGSVKRYMCSTATDETILFKIADVAQEELIKEGIQV